MIKRYTIGLDFGTLSARAVLLRLSDGKIMAEAEAAYAHGVMDERLPDGSALPGKGWALQDPADYLDCLFACVRTVMEKSGAPPEEVAGLGVDFTSCTLLPVGADQTPLCSLEPYKDNPHAYVKLWKHHRAGVHADRLNRLAEQRREPWLARYGGRISGEWLIPKAMELLAEAPQIYHAAARIIEAGDWVVSMLCGEERRSACQAGYKAVWDPESGYPSYDFLEALMPGLGDLPQKLGRDILPVGIQAGGLCEDMARKLGLLPGTAVATAIIDAHASVPGCGVGEEGTLLVILGTSSCHMLLSRRERKAAGLCGCVRDGILPGFYGYEAGQSCVGDHFSWYMENCLPARYEREAARQGISTYRLLGNMIERRPPGAHGLLALDWWGGVRSPLMDFSLSGLLAGLTLRTRPEDIYQALVEATAYGTRKIIQVYEESGLPVHRIVAAGGIAAKDPAVMQIYADVCGREIRVAGGRQSGARGSAILAAVAAGPALSGYADAVTAVQALGDPGKKVFRPDAARARAYDALYKAYSALYSYFGEGGSELMHRLHSMNETKEETEE